MKVKVAVMLTLPDDAIHIFESHHDKLTAQEFIDCYRWYLQAIFGDYDLSYKCYQAIRSHALNTQMPIPTEQIYKDWERIKGHSKPFSGRQLYDLLLAYLSISVSSILNTSQIQR